VEAAVVFNINALVSLSSPTIPAPARRSSLGPASKIFAQTAVVLDIADLISL
jgi:hypothetical protein